MRRFDVALGKAGLKIALYRAFFGNAARIDGSPKSSLNPVGEYFHGGVELTEWMKIGSCGRDCWGGQDGCRNFKLWDEVRKGKFYRHLL